MKTLITILSLFLTASAMAQFPYTSAATNPPVDGQVLTRSGGVGGHNKWSVAGGGGATTNYLAAGTNINLVTNGTLITISIATNTVVASGTNITISTNGGVYTVSLTTSNIFNAASSTTISNIIQAISGTNNGGPNIGPGTLNEVAMFVNKTNVGDSTIRQDATNQWSFASGGTNTFSTRGTNLIFGDNTVSTTSNSALALVVSPAGAGQYNELFSYRGLGDTRARNKILVSAGWIFNGYSSGGGADAACDLLPAVAGLSVGTVSPGSPCHIFAADATGGFFGADGVTFKGGTWGMTMDATGIGINLLSGPNRIVTIQNAVGGQNGLSLGAGKLGFGPAQSGAWSTFLSVGIQNHYMMLGTNNNSVTPGPTEIVHGAISDDNAVDRAGNSIAFVGGPASGAGTNGEVKLGTFMQGASGFGYNAIQTNRFVLHGNYINLTTNVATTVVTFTVPTSLTCAGVKFFGTTEIKDGTDIATLAENFVISAVNKAGTVTATNAAVAFTSSIATGSAAITNTWTCTVSSTTVSLKCKCNTGGINATTSRLVGARIELDSDSVSAVDFR